MLARTVVGRRALVAVLAVAAALLVPAVALSGNPASAATSFQQIAADSGAGSATHNTTADNVQAVSGNTIVSVFQVGRASSGCSCALNIGWATSTDGGAHWQSGTLPGYTTSSSPAGPYARVTDASVTHDDVHGRFMAVGALYAQNGSSFSQQVAMVSTSTDGIHWSTAAVAVGNGTTVRPDKTWVGCNNAGTQDQGHCYLTFSNLANNSELGVAVSTDGGASWSSPVFSNGATFYDSVPAILRDGTVIVVGTTPGGSTAGSLRAATVTETNGTLSLSSVRTPLAIHSHTVQPMRAFPKPSVAVDPSRGANGRIYVTFHGCPGTSCSRNDVLLTTSDDGVTWTSLQPLAVDPAGVTTIDHFDAGIGFDTGTGGTSGHLGIVFFYYPDATCTVGCQIHTGLTLSTDGGTTWSPFSTLTPTPTNSSWLYHASQGQYLTDYNSVVFPGNGANAVTAFPFALSAPSGGTLAQHMYASVVPVTTGTTPPPPPGAPTITNAVPGATAGTAVISFTLGSPTGTNPTYTVRETSPSAGAHTATGSTSPITVSGLSAGTTYQFTVTATAVEGTSPSSPPSSVTMPAAATAPSAPAQVDAVGGDQQVAVSWPAPANGGSPITSYQVTASPAPTSGANPRSVNGTTTSLAFTNLTNGTSYTFTVSAVNAVGTGPGTASASVKPVGKPGAPTIGTATAFAGGATVNFAVPASDGGSPIDLYTVTDAAGNPLATGTVSPIVVSGLTNGTTYQFKVFAHNTSGNGPASAASNAVTPVASVPPPVITPPAPPPVVPPGPTPPVVTPPTGSDGSGVAGYWLLGNTGEVRSFGTAADLHSTPAFTSLGTDVAVGLAATADRTGAWVAAANGKVLALGSAQHFGDMSGTALARPIVGIAATPSDQGYWLVASDGGIFSFGDATFQGSTGAIRLNQPIVGMASTPTGQGYWLVASDGGIFSFGDATFYGSTGDISLNRPIVGMAGASGGGGYWFVGDDGGIFSFGDATFYGSTGDISLNRPIVGMAGASGGGGYWFVGDDGGVFAFGTAPFEGSLGSVPGSKVVSMSAA